MPNGLPGINGFLGGVIGSRASLMLDIVFLAMFAVIPVLLWSIYQVKYRHRYQLHKRVQLTLGGILLVTVALFEIDMRIHGWRERAEPSRFFGQDGAMGLVDWSLYVHLIFAISTSLLWIYVVATGLKYFPSPAQPNEFSTKHKFWAKLAALDMCLTASTGWVFYWLAFVE